MPPKVSSNQALLYASFHVPVSCTRYARLIIALTTKKLIMGGTEGGRMLRASLKPFA